MIQNKMINKYIDTNLVNEITESYLQYSLSAITRAIPDFRDGLIPVYRRILWVAGNHGYSSNTSHRKSAKLEGAVMGLLHPHSGSYGSIVSLTTNYNHNYPLLEGQGSFGDSTSSAASARYTEIRLQKFTEEILLDEVESLELKDSYDGSNKEPIYLNAKLPLLLLRGSNSIAVGFATNIPQYNLKEICDYLLNGKIKNLIPDFPTGPNIYFDENNINDKGIIQRAIISNELSETIGKRKKKNYTRIEFTNLPHNTNPEKIGEQVKKLVQNEQFQDDWIISIEDLSDRNGDCISISVLTEKKSQILEYLYKYTDLQNTFSINFTVIVDGIPKVLTPTEYLDIWKTWRINKISEYHSLKISQLELESLLLKEILLVLNDKSKVLEVLNNNKLSYQDSINIIKDYYSISTKSSEYFLNLPIKKLLGLEIEKYNNQYKDILSQINFSKSVVLDPKKFFIEEIKILSKKYSYNRKSKIIYSTLASAKHPEKINNNNNNKIKSFSIDTKKGIIKKGYDYSEKILLIADDGKAYKVGPTTPKSPLSKVPIKILYSILESKQVNSKDYLELIDNENKVAKKVKISEITATSKGTLLGFEKLTSAKINNSNNNIKIKSKCAKPHKI